MEQKFIGIFFPVLLTTACGYLARKTGVLSKRAAEEWLRTVVSFFLPCLAFYAVLTHLPSSLFSAVNFLPAFGIYAMVAALFSGSIFLPFLRADQSVSRTFLYLTVVNNFYFLPLPFITYLYKRPGLGIFFMLVLGLEFGKWTIGTWIMRDDISFRAQMRYVCTPLFLTILAAFLLVAARLNTYVPRVLVDTARFIGMFSIPVGVFLTGALLAEARLARKHLPPAVMLSLVRGICYPALIIMSATMLARTIAVPDRTFNIILLALCMPPAYVPSSFLDRLGNGDKEFADAAVLHTTIVSAVTVPVLFLLFAR